MQVHTPEGTTCPWSAEWDWDQFHISTAHHALERDPAARKEITRENLTISLSLSPHPPSLSPFPSLSLPPPPLSLYSLPLFLSSLSLTHWCSTPIRSCKVAWSIEVSEILVSRLPTSRRELIRKYLLQYIHTYTCTQDRSSNTHKHIQCRVLCTLVSLQSSMTLYDSFHMIR